MKRKFVLIIPSYNEALNIEPAIKAVLHNFPKNTNDSYHILVVDGNSPDKTADIVRSLIPKHPNLHLLIESKTLIDTGVPTKKAYQGLLKQLKSFGLKPNNIERVILTHLHNDHIGLAEVLREQGVEIWAGLATKKRQEIIVEEWKNLYENTLKELDLFSCFIFSCSRDLIEMSVLVEEES